MEFKYWKPEPHDFMVKGKGYRPPFLSGAGDVHFELTEYVSCSLSWVLQIEWEILYIKPLMSEENKEIKYYTTEFGEHTEDKEKALSSGEEVVEIKIKITDNNATT